MSEVNDREKEILFMSPEEFRQFAGWCHKCDSKCKLHQSDGISICTNEDCEFSDPQKVWEWIESSFPKGMP